VVLLAKVNVVHDTTKYPFLSVPFETGSVWTVCWHPFAAYPRRFFGKLPMELSRYAATQRPSALIVEFSKPFFSLRTWSATSNVLLIPGRVLTSTAVVPHFPLRSLLDFVRRVAQQATFFANEFSFCVMCCSRKPIHAGLDVDVGHIFHCDQRPSQWRSSEVALTLMDHR
jgi:hypothetical protein